LVAVLQVGRLSAFMADSSRAWGSAVPDPVAANHQCLSAYLHAADLSRRGVTNNYETQWYPAFNEPVGVTTGLDSPVNGLGRWIDDPYQYPPPFLVLPRLALALTNSFDAIRTVWFARRLATFLVGAILLARWIGGRDGTIVALMIPAVLASVPTLLNFQFGQFHAWP